MRRLAQSQAIPDEATQRAIRALERALNDALDLIERLRSDLAALTAHVATL